MTLTNKNKRIENPLTAEVKKFILKHPDLPNMTTAKAFVKNHPDFKKSVEQIRDVVRMLKGAKGEIKRAVHVDFRKQLEALKKTLPKGDTERIEPYYLPKANKNILVIGDIHLPYHDDAALFASLEYGLQQNVDTILINGDLIDFSLISRHEKDIRKRSVSYEMDTARSFLKGLRDMFPNALILYKYGNHDIRFEKWIMQKCPELFDLPGMRLEDLLECTKHRIQVIYDKQIIWAGKMAVLHGHEIGLMSGGVNPARSARLKLNKSVIINHFHRSTQDMGKNLGEYPYSCYSNGCLCDLFPAYMGVHNQWNHGFIHLTLDNQGNYKVITKSIIEGKVY